MVGVGHGLSADGVRTRASDRIDLEAAPDELLAAIGPSGSGKSILLSTVDGLERPTRGGVFINGADMATMDVAHRAAVCRHSVDYIFRDYNLIPFLSALENAEMPLQLNGVSPLEVREAAMIALEEVDVAELVDHFPERLSGGQRQRIAIVQGLVGSHSVILADEPVGALGLHTNDQTLLVLCDYINTGVAGTPVTYEARMVVWADHAVFLHGGHIVDRPRGDSLRGLLTDTAPRT